ncbi:MAG: hypothetical protein EPN23_07660 [Verrucomicrobia bacterium]|nr:MAG: hypothetical protein EPN23_07660 [Verrucomicrobiota bacterium]
MLAKAQHDADLAVGPVMFSSGPHSRGNTPTPRKGGAGSSFFQPAIIQPIHALALYGDTISATGGAFFGGVGAQAGQMAADMIFQNPTPHTPPPAY